MKMVLRLLTTALLGLALAGLSGSALAAPGGNADAAHLCQQGGYARLKGSDGTTLGNAGDCVRYAAHGGTIVGVSACSVTSTTGCLVFDNVTLPSVQGTGNSITLTGSISFVTACPIPLSAGICYPPTPNDLATGTGSYVETDAGGSVVSHGTFRIADTTGSSEGLFASVYLDSPGNPSTCTLATFDRVVYVAATLLDGSTGATQDALIAAGVGTAFAVPQGALQYVNPFVDTFSGQSSGITITC